MGKQVMTYEEFANLGDWEISTDKGKPWAYDRAFGPYCSTIDIARNNTWLWEFSPDNYIEDPSKRIVLRSGHPCPTVDAAMREMYGSMVSISALAKMDIPSFTTGYDEA